MCRAGSKDKNHKIKQPKNKEWKKHLKKTTEESASDSPTSSDDEFFCQAVRHLKQVKKIKTEEQDKTITITDRRCNCQGGTRQRSRDQCYGRASVQSTDTPSQHKPDSDTKQDKAEHPSKRATCERRVHNYHQKQDSWC